MPNRAITALTEIMRFEIDLSKSRLETLCLMVVGMVSARSVNLSHIACERPGTVQTASTYRRLQRFGEHFAKGSIECLWVDHPEYLREGVMRWDGMLQLQEVSEKAFFCATKSGHLGARG